MTTKPFSELTPTRSTAVRDTNANKLIELLLGRDVHDPHLPIGLEQPYRIDVEAAQLRLDFEQWLS
ncbi:MAG: hypothetical protein WBZ37_07660 [Mycobacterium sp.]